MVDYLEKIKEVYEMVLTTLKLHRDLGDIELDLIENIEDGGIYETRS